MAVGKIIKSLSGFYYIEDHDVIYQCRGRGNFRKRKLTPLVGDWVEYESTNTTDGMVLAIHERRNALVRPPIANVDQALVTFAAKEPDFDTGLLDRFLVHIEAHGISPLICITKMDKVEASLNDKASINDYAGLYREIGYTVFLISGNEEQGLEEIVGYLDGKTTVLAGQSGVGKSSLLNRLRPELEIETGEISKALSRGKHTTRHVELLKVGGGFVADTPGFSSLDFQILDGDDLSRCFPEFQEVSHECKFRGCSHLNEPDCAVRARVESGDIAAHRYQHYKQFYQEISNRKKRY
ncbi:putative ribosome biogenesis GTPase RsgA [Pullulanibacillus camelliae]|uniref:Small ribosomal subunit biogenesis GTPase RsgA n=1 Tax=Pullulanibacillus camelliae TaxID=1707096 RepID=A0A8J2YH84_9BACL|nr:ribosome small subunit-dependent GTPase A [Pullulanibacillus camelliae]GGE41809.1 putative ribosome biogenesis GTPase RsgA [Pullulanibacillus camelliae]